MCFYNAFAAVNQTFPETDNHEPIAAKSSMASAGRSAGILAGDVAFELVDGFVLGVDGPVHEVADGNDAGDPPVFQYRQMPHAMIGHQVHAIFNGMKR
jgi:hypothetical protein